jgi:hypothetical protein
MVKGSFEGSGAPKECIQDELARLVDLIGHHFPSDVPRWHDIESVMPDSVKAIRLAIASRKYGEIEKIIYEKEYKASGSVAISFVFLDKKDE